MGKSKFDFYTWREFDADCRRVAAWAKKRKFRNIYGIPRGGLVVAVRLSHLLGLPLVWKKKDIGKKTLIVDDIVDTGKTARRLMSGLKKKQSLAVLYFNPDSKFTPAFFVREKKKWIIFPWETTETSKYDYTEF